MREAKHTNFREHLPSRPLYVSSNCERSPRRVSNERLEHHVGDAPLEAPHRLPARLAFPKLLPVVGPAARIASGLADGDHVHDLVEATVARQRDLVPEHLAARGFDGSDASSEGAKCSLFGNLLTSPTIPMIFAARIDPTPKTSVRVVPEASTSSRMHSAKEATFRSRAPTHRAPARRPATFASVPLHGRDKRGAEASRQPPPRDR
jgi:hypothetical protein